MGEGVVCCLLQVQIKCYKIIKNKKPDEHAYTPVVTMHLGRLKHKYTALLIPSKKT